MSSHPKGTRKFALLDDDEAFREYLETYLKKRGYAMVGYSTPGKFLDDVARAKPDLILIDLVLPNLSGWDVLKTLRGNEAFRRTPIVLLSGEYRKPSDVVKGFELGADDYFTKPLEAEVMLARIEALLRRYSWQGGEPEKPVMKLGSLTVSPSDYVAKLGGRQLSLTRLEFELLRFFLEHPNHVHTRAALLENVWKHETSLQSRTIDKHVESLRKKLGPLGERIQTVVGVGYQLKTG